MIANITRETCYLKQWIREAQNGSALAAASSTESWRFKRNASSSTHDERRKGRRNAGLLSQRGVFAASCCATGKRLVQLKSVSWWEKSMKDGRTKAEALAEIRKQREAGETATDDGMRLAPESDAKDVDAVHYRTPGQWTRSTRKWRPYVSARF
jgi:hypothetical protein